MTFEQLHYGDVFRIDGAPFQTWRKGERIVIAIPLTEDYDHMRDAQGEPLTEAFSDLRINKNNATTQQCADYLNTLNHARNIPL